MAPDDDVNVAERRRWNDPYWSSVWPRRESLTSSVTAALHERLALRDGDVALDVGSGAGAATLAAGRAVGPTGRVVGVDVSEPLVAHARDVAAAAGVENVTFVVGDVQVDALRGGPFSVAMSQFGVMFFERPAVAFANVRTHMARHGRLGFACWQPASENPWFLGNALRGLVAPPPPPPRGAHPTGPFALGDPADVRSLLARAGWSAVGVEARSGTATVARDAIADEGQPRFLGVAEDRLDEARAAVDAHLARFADPAGGYTVPIAYLVVTATA